MLTRLILFAVAAYSGFLVWLEIRGGRAAVEPFLLDRPGLNLEHVHSSFSAALLGAAALLAVVAARIAAQSASPSEGRRPLLVLAGWLLSLALEERFRLVATWSQGDRALEVGAWSAWAVLGAMTLFAVSQTSERPRGAWLWGAAATGFALNLGLELVGSPWLTAEDLPRLWGAALLLLAAAQRVDEELERLTWSGSAFTFGRGAGGPAGALGRRADDRRPASAPPAAQAPAPAPAPAGGRLTEIAHPTGEDKKRGAHPKDGRLEPVRSSNRSPAAPPRKLLSH